MNGDTNVNLNAANCLKSVSDFGVEHVHNICTGTITDVPWGSADWLIACVVGLFFVGVASIFLGMGWTMFRDR